MALNIFYQSCPQKASVSRRVGGLMDPPMMTHKVHVTAKVSFVGLVGCNAGQDLIF